MTDDLLESMFADLGWAFCYGPCQLFSGNNTCVGGIGDRNVPDGCCNWGTNSCAVKIKLLFIVISTVYKKHWPEYDCLIVKLCACQSCSDSFCILDSRIWLLSLMPLGADQFPDGS